MKVHFDKLIIHICKNYQTYEKMFVVKDIQFKIMRYHFSSVRFIKITEDRYHSLLVIMLYTSRNVNYYNLDKNLP